MLLACEWCGGKSRRRVHPSCLDERRRLRAVRCVRGAEMSLRQIATVMECSPQTVLDILHGARRKLIQARAQALAAARERARLSSRLASILDTLG